MKKFNAALIILSLLLSLVVVQPAGYAEANVITPQTTPVEITRKRDYNRTIKGDRPQRSTFVGYHRYRNNGDDLTLNRYSLVFDLPGNISDTKPWKVFDQMRIVLDNHVNIDIDTSKEENWEEVSGGYQVEATDIDYLVDNGKHVTTFYLIAKNPNIEDTQTWHVYMPTNGNEFEDDNSNLYSFGEDQHINVTVDPDNLSDSPSENGIVDIVKISDTSGHLSYSLPVGSFYGKEVEVIGDFFNDGNDDIVISAVNYGQTPTTGAFWIYDLDENGDIIAEYLISDTTPGLIGALNKGDLFGRTIASLGDLNNDGVIDLAVSAYQDDTVGKDTGAIYILFMKSDATVKSYKKITDGLGSFSETLGNQDRFGWALANIGDIDNDGVTDIAVGSRDHDFAGNDAGALWVLNLESNGNVKNQTKITNGLNGFNATFSNQHRFGASIISLGDRNNDGVNDIAVGAEDGQDGYGAVYIIYLDSNSQVISHTEISNAENTFDVSVVKNGLFGSHIANAKDLDGNGTDDLIVGQEFDSSESNKQGSVFVLLLNSDDSVKKYIHLSGSDSLLSPYLEAKDQFGSSVAYLGDIDGDSHPNIAVGAWLDDDGGKDKGAVYILNLDTDYAKNYQNNNNVNQPHDLEDNQNNQNQSQSRGRSGQRRKMSPEVSSYKFGLLRAKTKGGVITKLSQDTKDSICLFVLEKQEATTKLALNTLATPVTTDVSTNLISSILGEKEWDEESLSRLNKAFDCR